MLTKEQLCNVSNPHDPYLNRRKSSSIIKQCNERNTVTFFQVHHLIIYLLIYLFLSLPFRFSFSSFSPFWLKEKPVGQVGKGDLPAADIRPLAEATSDFGSEGLSPLCSSRDWFVDGFGVREARWSVRYLRRIFLLLVARFGKFWLKILFIELHHG